MYQYEISQSLIQRSRKRRKGKAMRKYYQALFGCIVFSAGVLFITSFLCQDYFRQNAWIKSIKYFKRKNDLEEMGCKIPQLDPFDPSILQFVNPPPALNCTKSYPLLYSLNETSHLIQLVRPERYGLSKCCYRKITRIRGNDNSVGISKSCTRIITSVTKISSQEEFIAISCIYNKTKKSIFMDMLGTVPMKRELKLRMSILNHQENPSIENVNNEALKKFNVVILGLNSVSHMHFIRIMPKTYEFLTKNLGAIGMNGYNKVGYNSYPNIVPILTGRSEQEFESDRTSLNQNQPFFDNSPFIWKDFAAQGYVTGFSEDAPGLSTFNYQKPGFNNSSVDYYRRPLSLVQEKFIGHHNFSEENLCYGPRLSFEVSLDFINHMAYTMQAHNLNYFQFVWATSLFHTHLNIGKHGDSLLRNTLKQLESRKYFKNTIFILMSDHGMRFGRIRQTAQGKIEDMKPFLYLVLPKRFRTMFPQAVENLRRNVDRLTTPFDLYATLQDILETENLSSSRIQERSNSIKRRNSRNPKNPPRKMSLFLQIPRWRNCKDAQIPMSYCVCDVNGKEDVEVTNELVKSAAEFFLEHINRVLKDYLQCSPLTIGEITMASVNLRSRPIAGKNEGDDFELDIGLSVLPSNATFEIAVRKVGSRNANETSWTLSDINTTNFYGKGSDCVEDSYVKLFCFCL